MNALTLEIPPQLELLPVATTFSELGSQSLGLAKEQALALTLATEELFANFAQLNLPTTWELENGSHHVNLRVSFPHKDLDLASVNMVAKVDLAEEGESLGWLVAAKCVDRFRIEHNSQSQKNTSFVLTQKRFYPQVEPSESWPKPNQQVVAVRTPDEQELTLFCARLMKAEDSESLPGLLRRPGRLLAMMNAGEAIVRVAFSATGEPLGGAVLELRREKLAFLHGPYLFDQPAKVNQILFHELVKAVARTQVRGVFSVNTEELHQTGEVEYLGCRTFEFGGGKLTKQRLFYRHITDDEGFVVWSAPALKTYLESTYERLELAREVEAWHPSSLDRPTHSVLSTEIRQDLKLAILRPLLDGADLVDNLRAHIKKLRQDEIFNINFELDTGESWQMAFAAPLLESGFRPQVLIPDAGKGDQVYFQLANEDEA